MEPRRIPNKLKMFRCSCGYSQKRVASILVLSDTSTLSRWEHGSVIPNSAQLFRMAKLYNALPHELLEPLWELIAAPENLLAQDYEQFNTSQPFI